MFCGLLVFLCYFILPRIFIHQGFKGSVDKRHCPKRRFDICRRSFAVLTHLPFCPGATDFFATLSLLPLALCRYVPKAFMS